MDKAQLSIVGLWLHFIIIIHEAVTDMIIFDLKTARGLGEWTRGMTGV